jgi:hypothetical protein
VTAQASLVAILSEHSSSNSVFDAEAERTAIEMLKRLSTTDTVSGPQTVMNDTGFASSSPAATMTPIMAAAVKSPAVVGSPVVKAAETIVYTHQEAAIGIAKYTVPKVADSIIPPVKVAPSVMAPISNVAPPVVAPPVSVLTTVVYTHEQVQAAKRRTASKSDPPLPQPALFDNVITPREEDHGRYVVMPVERKLSEAELAQRVIVDLVSKDGPDDSIIQLRLTYREREKINFPFHLKEDTATDVISEMVSENILEGDDQGLARRKLEEAIREHYISMKGSTASSTSDQDLASRTSLDSNDARRSSVVLEVCFT